MTPDLSTAGPKSAYRKPVLVRLAARDTMPGSGAAASTGALLPMGILRCIQSAFDELETALDGNHVQLKAQILEEVVAGRLTEAVRVAIVGAGRSASGNADPAHDSSGFATRGMPA